MARGQQQTYTDFSGGINADAAPYLLTEKQCQDARNVHTSLTGAIRKRNGFTTVGSLSASLDSVHSLAASNATAKTLIVVGKQAGASNDRICKVTTSGTITNLKSSLAQGLRWSWAQASTTGSEGPMYGMNGANTPQQWDGSAGTTTNWTATTGSVPNGTMIQYHQTRLWVAGVSAQPNRVYYSGLSGSPVPLPDPAIWEADGFVDIEPNDGDKITALGTVGSYLLICKGQKTYVIYDPVSAANRRISMEIGCSAPRSMVETVEGTFFLSDDYGLVKTDGQSVQPVSQNIESLLDTASEDFSSYKLAAGTYDEGRYYLSVAMAGGANDTTFEYDTISKSWWRHDCASNQFALLDPEADPVLYSINPATPSLEKAFVNGEYQDAGVNYVSGTYWKGPYYVWGAPHVNKRLRQIRLDGRGEWTTSTATSFSDSYENLDAEIWETGTVESPIVTPDTYFGVENDFGGVGDFGAGGSTTLGQLSPVERRIYTPGFGRAWSLKFSNDDPYGMEIYSMTGFITPRKD